MFRDVQEMDALGILAGAKKCSKSEPEFSFYRAKITKNTTQTQGKQGSQQDTRPRTYTYFRLCTAAYAYVYICLCDHAIHPIHFIYLWIVMAVNGQTCKELPEKSYKK